MTTTTCPTLRATSQLLTSVTGLLLTAVAAAAQNAPALPATVVAELRKDFVADGMETRYLAASADLNGDGKDELLVYVVGPAACGTGGCPTRVYTPDGAGMRRVGNISVSNPPIRMAAEKTNGWNNLIVHVSGGGAAARDVVMAFNGRTYPGNPTVNAPRATTAAAAKVLIPDFDSFDKATPLPAAGAPAPAAPGAAPPQASAGASPSFDCAKATAPVEKLICGDAGLAASDRKVAELYAALLKNVSADDAVKQRTAQRAWLNQRNACGTNRDAKGCTTEIYQRRVVELSIMAGSLEAPKPVDFTCAGRPGPFTVAYYQTEPPAAVVTEGGTRQAIALITRSGSGAHYVGNGVDFWEHGGEATVRWDNGVEFICRPMR